MSEVANRQIKSGMRRFFRRGFERLERVKGIEPLLGI
jgi:hypothetical protein